MSTVYLHIGMPKTGTTAIQYFLTDNPAALKKHGICFPDFNFRFPGVGLRRNGHFLACSQVDENGKKIVTLPIEEYTPIMDQIGKLGKEYERIILSDEALWRARSRQPEFWKRLKRDLADRGLDLRVIVYLRRQDTFMESLYRQKIKEATTQRDFHDYLRYIVDVYPLDYPAYMDMLSEILGRENLFIRIYEKSQYKGAEHNIFSDFLDIFGLTLQDGFEIRQREQNISLDGIRLDIQRILNQLSKVPFQDPYIPPYETVYESTCETPYETQALMKGLRELQGYAGTQADYTQTTLFDPKEQEAFLGRFAASNERLAREYLGREDGVLFYDAAIKKLPQYQQGQDDLLLNTILFYGRAVQLLEQRNRQLKKELEKVRQDMRDVRESVLLYRLKRKIRHLSGKDKT